ncbi:small heat shock protein [Pholiota conissans]|uniref:Small heat shock protein n=1 Tax=Pholiota conissans TaxID=109636 RepID=A0A9P6CYP6_9AGAR|nr:small heat shock protein [Pholiota conissans]
MSVFFYEPFYDFERFFDEALPTTLFRAPGQVAQRNIPEGAVRTFRPRMDLHEDKEKNLVTATFEFPGVKKEDIQIDVNNGRLTVSAETKQSSDYEEGGYAVRERRFGQFSRTLQLPEGIKEQEINASVDSGVLTVTFPRSTPEQAPKRITIA